MSSPKRDVSVLTTFTSPFDFVLTKLSNGLTTISKGYDTIAVQNFREMLGLRVCSEA